MRLVLKLAAQNILGIEIGCTEHSFQSGILRFEESDRFSALKPFSGPFSRAHETPVSRAL